MNITTLIIISPIFMFSIISVAIIIDRFLFFRKNAINIDIYREFIPAKLSALKNKCFESHKENIFNFFLFKLLSNTRISKDEATEFFDSAFSEIYLKYSKRINYLGIFAKLSTLIGLFGTVIGMIIAFNNIVQKGTSTASIVAGGISAALITTAIGLSVAIPTTFFHDYFQNKIEKEVQKIQIITSEIMVTLYKLKNQYKRTIK